ncbi:MAG: aminotransferase class V-fold PLP-dependent enzyme [Pirellulaceae bacterium]|nr:aminotransferase class V-fold PLP-dependent enzyme [Pirellulaceae bacterium]
MTTRPLSSDDFRKKMAVSSKWAYFDHAAVSPISLPAQRAMRLWLEEAGAEGEVAWGHWVRRLQQIRARAAKMIGAETDEIALVPNTTTGINLVADGFPWQEGDNIVTLSNEFPTNLYPWMNQKDRGIEVRQIEIDTATCNLQRIAQACDAKTRIVAISWVSFSSGWRLDLSEIVNLVHQKNAYLFLDAIQGLGVFPIDIRQTPVDFLAADGHKWMMGPEGAGIFFLQKQHLDLLRPIGVGWNSVVDSHNFSKRELNLRNTASRYEGGSQNMVGFHALGASLDLFAELGLTSTASPIADRISQVTELACERLQNIGAKIFTAPIKKHQSGILSFEIPGRDPHELRRLCLQTGVVLACREERLRISPHAYTSEADLDRLIDALQ